jgi:hypothetical protein
MRIPDNALSFLDPGVKVIPGFGITIGIQVRDFGFPTHRVVLQLRNRFSNGVGH